MQAITIGKLRVYAGLGMAIALQPFATVSEESKGRWPSEQLSGAIVAQDQCTFVDP